MRHTTFWSAFLLVSSLLLVESRADETPVRICSNPRGAVICVNGKSPDRRTPARLSLNVDDAIVLKREGYRDLEFRVRPNTRMIRKDLHEITKFRMLVELKTADVSNAGTDKLTIALYLNGDPKQRRVLNRPGRDDFRVGGIDRFELDFDCPTEKLKGAVVVAESGEDAWKCDFIAIRMVKGELSTRLYSRRINKWISGDGGEGRQLFVVRFIRPGFEPVPDPKTNQRNKKTK